MTPIPQTDPLSQVLAEYMASQNRGGDPNLGAPPAPQSFTLPINGKPLQFANPEDAGHVVTSTIQDYEGRLQTLETQRQQLLDQLNNLSKTAPSQDFSAPKSAVDPEEYAKALLTDPVKAAQMVDEHNPKMKALQQELEQVKARTTASDFLQRHPAYNNPEHQKTIEDIRHRMNLPFTPENLELIAGFAQSKGILPSEQQIYAQRQASEMQRFQQYVQNPADPQIGGPQNFAPQYSPTQNGYNLPMSPAMTYAQSIAPPPSPGRVGNTPSGMSYDQVDRVAQTAPLADLKMMIERMGGGQR